MKKAHFTETQIVNILKLADSGLKVEEISQQTGSVMPLSITGKQNMAGWKPMMLKD